MNAVESNNIINAIRKGLESDVKSCLPWAREAEEAKALIWFKHFVVAGSVLVTKTLDGKITFQWFDYDWPPGESMTVQYMTALIK